MEFDERSVYEQSQRLMAEASFVAASFQAVVLDASLQVVVAGPSLVEASLVVESFEVVVA